MDEIHKNIIENFTGSFVGFEKSQKSIIELIQKMPKEKATMFNEWIIELNVAVAKEDKPALIKLLSKVSSMVETQ